MKPKKNIAVNLEKRRAVHIQIGLIIALSFVLVSLEWGTRIATTEARPIYMPVNNYEEEIAPMTERIENEKPKIPKLLVPIPVEADLVDPGADFSDMFNSEDQGVGYTFDNWIDEPEEPLVETYRDWQVQIKAEFPGGEKEMMKWLYSNINYPQECIDHGIEGKVMAEFTVSKYGKVTDIRITRSVHRLLDEEVIRVLSVMPRFNPAMRYGELVPVYMNIPVVFDLR